LSPLFEEPREALFPLFGAGEKGAQAWAAQAHSTSIPTNINDSKRTTILVKPE